MKKKSRRLQAGASSATQTSAAVIRGNSEASGGTGGRDGVTDYQSLAENAGKSGVAFSLWEFTRSVDIFKKTPGSSENIRMSRRIRRPRSGELTFTKPMTPLHHHHCAFPHTN